MSVAYKGWEGVVDGKEVVGREGGGGWVTVASRHRELSCLFSS